MLQIQDISFGYRKGANVLDHFSLDFNAGGIYGLLGRNGTGKSTLLYLIMGLLHPHDGHILYNGKDTRLRHPEALQDMFIVPEEYDLPSVMLDDYVKTIRQFYPRFSDEILDNCLAGFDMPRETNLSALSMGQKKKIYMCIALAANTRLLVMDEPTNGLDIPSKSQFRKVVKSGMTEDKTIIISTHQVRDVELLLDRVVVIERNRVLLRASMQDILEHYRFCEVDRDALPANRLYEEPSPRGYSVLVPRMEGEEATPVNLEHLFNFLLSNPTTTLKI